MQVPVTWSKIDGLLCWIINWSGTDQGQCDGSHILRSKEWLQAPRNGLLHKSAALQPILHPSQFPAAPPTALPNDQSKLGCHGRIHGPWPGEMDTHTYRCRYKHFLSHWCHWCCVQQMASLSGFMNGFPGGPSFKISPSYRHRYYTPHSFSFWRDVSLLLPSYHSLSISWCWNHGCS